MNGRLFFAWMIVGVVCAGALPVRAAIQNGSGDRVRAQDVLNITVVDQPTLTQKYTVDADGRIALPLIGILQAAGLTPEELAAEMRRRLSDGFFTNPQVRIEIERAMRVFVFGGVTAPGMYPLTKSMTLMEVLARAGYQGASEAIIVRSKDGGVSPAMPDQKDAEVIRVNLREFEKELEKGQLSRNVLLADADTIYVPRFDPNRVYVSGQVRTPGAYSVPDKTTVYQALALAGGPTERASLGKVKIMRLVDGKQKTINAKLEDFVRPGDTIVVPERYF
jgi:polysaccharide export outer membrane protein